MVNECIKCESLNTYVTEKFVVCRKCGYKKKIYHSQAEKQDITKLKMEKV